MTMTLLEIVTEALDDINSLVVPTWLIGNSDDTARQAIAIAKKIGRELTRDHSFQQHQRIHTLTTVAGTDNYALPDDYDRFIPMAAWDSTRYLPMVGNETPQDWATLTNNQVGVATDNYFQLRNNRIYIYPTPTSVWSASMPYYTKNYCKSALDVEQSTWLLDTDMPLVTEDLFIAGVRYYFCKANNIPYADAELEYNSIIERREITNTPGQVLNLSAGTAGVTRDRYLNIPDGVPT